MSSDTEGANLAHRLSSSEISNLGSWMILEEESLKKNLNASRPSEHPSVRGGKNVEDRAGM